MNGAKNKEFTTLSVDSDLSDILRLLSQRSGKSQVQIIRELVRPIVAKRLKIKYPKDMPKWKQQVLVDMLIQAEIDKLRRDNLD